MPSIKPVESDDDSDDTSAFYSASDGCSEHSDDPNSGADNANDANSSTNDEDNGETRYPPADEQATTTTSTTGAGESKSTSRVQETTGGTVENTKANDDFVGTCATVAVVDRASPRSCMLLAPRVVAADTRVVACTSASARTKERHRLLQPPPDDPARPTIPNEKNGDTSKSTTSVVPPEFSATVGAADQQQSQAVVFHDRHRVSEYQSARVAKVNPVEENLGNAGGLYAFFAAITVFGLKAEVGEHVIHAVFAFEVGAHGRNI